MIRFTKSPMKTEGMLISLLTQNNHGVGRLDAKDPNSARLQRLQIIKGWVEDNQIQSKFDIGCADNMKIVLPPHR